MTTTMIHLALADDRDTYLPGQTLAGEFRVNGASDGELQAVELSVLWSTEGKGDEDMAVHFFERFTVDEPAPFDWQNSRSFSTVLPNSPQSYDGVIVKLRWFVRIRAFLSRGRQVVEDRPFRLGSIPPARAVLP